MRDKTKSKNRPLKNNLFLLSMVHEASKGRIIISILVIIAQYTSNFLFDVYMLRYVINGIQNNVSFKNLVVFVLLIVLFNTLTGILTTHYYEIYAPVSDKKIYRHIQKKVFKKAEEVELSCFEDSEFYDKYVKAVSEVSVRATQVLDSLSYIIGCIFNVLAMSLVIFSIDPWLTVFAILPFIVSLIFGKKFNRMNYDYNMEMQEKCRKRDYTRRVFYLSDYAKEMRLTNINKVMFKNFYESIKDIKDCIKKHGFKIGLMDYMFIAVNDIIVYLGTIIYSSYKTLVSKTMLYGDCVVVINTINSVAWSLREISDIFIQFQNHSLYIENLRCFLEHESSVAENPKGIEPPKSAVLKLENVSFKYPGSDLNTLKNINMEIKPGEKIALVGYNGSGKTTLIKLIMRMYDATEGEITLNGIPIKKIKLSSYRDMFATVFQDYKIFSLSVLENVLLKENIDEIEKSTAVTALKESGAYDKVLSLSNGIDTILTKEFAEDGAVLSGGEYQKIVIARVFAKPCDIAILDEPSSALDPIAEYKMYKAMTEACKDKTVIFISHRLSSAVLADKVYLIKDGEIAEHGTHFELLKKSVIYRDMWNKQAEKYVEKAEVL